MPAIYTSASALQVAHAAAKARANKVCRNEPGVISKYVLGELIAEIEDEAQQAMAALDITAAVTGSRIADRLKALIPM